MRLARWGCIVVDEMAYVPVKGPAWQELDRFLSPADPVLRLRHKLEALAAIHRHERFADLADDVERLLADEDVDGLVAHLNRDWFGLTRDAAGRWSPAAAPGDHPGAGPSWWSSWVGDAEGIVREAVQRAIEVSLGLAHVRRRAAGDGFDDYRDLRGEPLAPDRPGPDALRRNWSVEFWWVSPVGWLQAWLTWRHRAGDETDGAVSVTWLTPGTYEARSGAPHDLVQHLSDPPRHPEPHRGYRLDPTGTDDVPHPGLGPGEHARFGSWIVGHEHTRVVGRVTDVGTAPGDWPPVLPYVDSAAPGTPPDGPPSPIVTVSGDVADGGVGAGPEWDY